MTIVPTIPKYFFAGNIPDIIISTNNPVEFKLYKHNDSTEPVQIIDDSHIAIASKVTIKLRSFLESQMSAAPLTTQELSECPFPMFHYTINGTASAPFFVLPGGVDGLIDPGAFLQQNFLSWQPQTRHTSFHAPQWLRYASLQECKVFVKAYFSDKTEEVKELATMVSEKIYTLDVSYGKIRGKFAKQPLYYDIWVGDGTYKYSYEQRYILAESNEINEEYFVFENTLGGFDTARFYGENKEINEAEGRSSIIENTTSEYDVDFKRSWLKYTGFIPDEDHRLWIMEFFVSRMRFRVGRSSLDRIFVSKPKLESVKGDIGGYEFTYALAKTSKYQNLKRGKLPTNLEIVSPSDELFFLAPRLSQFPAANGVDILFPVQHPASDQWHTLSLAALKALLPTYPSEGSDGRYPAEKHSAEHAPEGADSLVDYYATKDHGHGQQYHPAGGSSALDFKADDVEADTLTARVVTVSDSVASDNYEDHQKGKGFSLHKGADGVYELEVGRVKAAFGIETDVLVKNKIRVTNAEEWSTDSNFIDTVVAVAGKPLERVITLKGSGATFAQDDLLRGSVSEGVGLTATFFGTYLERIEDFKFRISVDMGGAEPVAGMFLVKTGNCTNLDRQSSMFRDASKPAEFMYVSVDSHIITEQNIVSAQGDLRGFNFGVLSDNKPVEDRYFSIQRGKTVIAGRLIAVSVGGIEYPIPVDRGVWAADQKYYHYDRVSHAGAMWDCAVVSTTVAPGVNTDWTKRVDRGASGKDAPVLQTQFSINGTSAWHNTYQPGDRYRRESNDNGTSWSAAMPMIGEKGEIGADGKKTPYTDFSYAYGIVQPTAWSDTPPAKVEKQHLWERIQKYSPKADNSGWDLVSTSYAIINEYIQVGGVNLLNNSERISAINGFGEISTPRLVTLESGVTYCLSVEENNLVPNAGGWPKLFLWDANWGDVLPVIVIDWDMAKKHHLFAAPQSGTYRFVIYNHDNVAATGLYLKKVKLEAGTIPTAWSESPEDTQSKIDEANKKTYLTYHANTTTPSIPTGNGTTGGWHYKCEAGDLWVSVKKTLTIDAGTWSAPMALDSLPTDLVDKYGINAEVVRAQAVTSKFGTAINGGLVMTSQLLLRDLDGVEKAGMNGIPGDNYTNPSFWSGGSYAESLAGTAPICFRHNGVAKIGDLFYDPSGKVTLQKFGRPLILLTKGAVTPLGDIMAGSASGSATNSYSAFTANQTVSLPKTLTVTKQNSTLTVQSSISATAMVGSSQGFASSTLTVSLHRDGVKIAQLGYVEAQAPSVSVIDQQSPQSITNTATINMTITAEVGTYTIVCQAANNAFGGGLGQVATARCEIWSSEMKFDFVAKTERTELGSNGISTVFDSNNLEHTSWGADGKLGKVFKGRGTYDVPGVLFGYDVALTGGMNRRWGAYKEPSIGATKGGTGIYNVPHKVGHDQFTVTATAKYDGTYTVAHLVSWTATNIIVRITTLPGVLRDCGFTIIAIGNNQIE